MARDIASISSYFHVHSADALAAESGLFPGVVYYFSMWYKRRERQFRISLFFSAAALAGSFGGILAYVSGLSRNALRREPAC